MYATPGVYSPMGEIKQRMNKWSTRVAIVTLIYGLLQTIRMILLYYQFAKQVQIPDLDVTVLAIEWIMLIVWILLIIFFFPFGISFIKLSNIELRISLQAKWAGILLIIAVTLEIVNNFMFIENDFIQTFFDYLSFIPFLISFILIILLFKKLKELDLSTAKLNFMLIITISLDLISRILISIYNLVSYQTVRGGLTIGIITSIFYLLYIVFFVAALIKLGSDALTITEQPYMQRYDKIQPAQPVQYVGFVKVADGQTIPLESTSNSRDFMFCKNCGLKYHKRAKFCTNCGQSVEMKSK